MEYAAYLIELMNKALAEKGGEFPGVFDYEVSEEFGAWFVRYIMESEDAMAPAESICKQMCRKLVAEFFCRGMGLSADVLEKSLESVT